MIKKLLSILILLSAFLPTKATHLVGGSLSYQRLGVNSQGQVEYRVRLALYRDCTSDIKFDTRIKLGIHENRNNNAKLRTVNIRIDSEREVDPIDNANCGFQPNVCLMEGIYEEVIALPQSNFGYHLTYIRCCRNNLTNVPDGPGGEPDQGQTYYAFIPPTPVVNSSPRFSGVPVPFICAGDTASMLNTAIDPDGDSLVYRFTTPFQGGDLSQGNASANPDPAPFLSLPIDNISYNPGYNTSFPFGANGYTYINQNNGLTELMAPSTGFYAIAVEVLEYRNGQLLSTTRLELQIIVISCPPNRRPQFTQGTNNGTYYWEIEEGQQLCFDIEGTDYDNDQVELQKMGSIFTGANAATLNTVKGPSPIKSRFCWTPPCGYGRDEPYEFLLGLHDDGCPKKINNQTYTIKVNKFIGSDDIIGDLDPCEFEKGVKYRMNGSPGSTYDWQVIGGTITDGNLTNEIIVDWGSGSGGQIRVTEVSRYGCRGQTVVKNITLNPAPGKPTSNGSSIVCQFSTENYFTPPTPGINHTWFVEGGEFTGGTTTTTGNNVTVNWGKKGQGRLIVIGRNGEGCNSDSNIVIVDIRHPEPNIAGSFSVCPNSKSIDYFTQSNSGSTFQWNITGGTQVGGGNSNKIQVDWGNATTGVVEVIETDRYGCVSDPDTAHVKVDYELVLVFTQNPVDEVCEFENATYTVQNTNGSKYVWDVNGGNKIGVDDSLHFMEVQWQTAGIGKFTVFEYAFDNVNNKECKSQVIEQEVVIHPIPKADVIEGIKELCQTTELSTYTINGFANSNYVWKVDGSTVKIVEGQTTNSVKILWDQPGTFRLSVVETSEHGCIGPEIRTTIVVNPKPITTPIDGSEVFCYPVLGDYIYRTSGFGASEFFWMINGGTIKDQPSKTAIVVEWDDDWSANQNKYIKVLEVSDKGCAGDTQTIDVWYDKPSIDMRRVSVGLPDDRIEVKWELEDAPRYDNVIEIHRTEFDQDDWGKIEEVPGSDITYTDEGINTDKLRYSYFVRGYDLCNNRLTSEDHTNIMLTGEKTGPYEVEMSFTPYFGWDNGVMKYELYTMLVGRSDYELFEQVNSDQNIYIGEGLVHYEQCFRVKATELNGDNEESWSNEICFTFEPILFVPTAFTPNGDGLNENFDVVHRAIKEYEITIYNRWGEKIFYSEDIFSPWDGTYKGEIAQQGAYLFTIYYKGFNNRLKVETGTVTLIR